MDRTIEIQVPLPFPPELVWKALTDAESLGAWLMENDIQAQVGHQFTFRMAPQRGWDGITYCEVTELESQKTIAYTYRGSATGEKTLSCAGIKSETVTSAGKGIFTELDTVVRFTLREKRDANGDVQTILHLEHRGFTGLKLVLVSYIMGYGWKKSVLPRLPLVLERLANASPLASVSTDQC
jgi:uncharacterized protein YndB with AHSA1/START domain